MSNQNTTATNVQGPDTSSPLDNATKYFNNFYTVDLAVGSAISDAMVGFFQQYTGDPVAGKSLAATVLYTAKSQNVDPASVLSQFQQLPPNELNTYLVAFLNYNRVPTSILGVKTGTTTNSYVTRTILV
jgi:hypothetical protein